MPTLSPQVTPYYGGGQAVNPANVLQVTGTPSPGLIHEKLGTLAVDNSNGNVYCLGSLLGGVASWTVLGGTSVSIEGIVGNTGGEIFPIAGDVHIIGVGPLAFNGAGNILTGVITPGVDLVSTIQGTIGGPLQPTAGKIDIIGVGALSFSGAGSTLTGSITPGTFLTSTLTGNIGGVTLPTGGNFNIIGSGAISVSGAGSTLTISETPGTFLVSTITGTSGGALSPTTGNITLTGNSNEILISGAGSTLTFAIQGVFVAPGSIQATTTLTATLGNITATNGNLVLTAAGNKMVRTSVATTTAAGANSIGSVTLVGGTATVSTTAVTANSLIQIWRQSVGATGAAALGMLSVGTITAATSFDINAWSAASAVALQATDVSVIGWEIIN